MKRQVVVIGLGHFGTALALSLAERGVEVFAADLSEELVARVASSVTEAVCLDATDERALMRAAPERREVCICAISDRARDASIICTALLRQLGARRIIARANNDIHARILRLVGADQVVNPQREFGERFASRVIHESILGSLPLGDNLVITEVIAPPSFVGHTIASLKLPRRYGATVVAIRRLGRNKVVIPEPTERVRADDVLVFVSAEDAVERLVERS